MWSVVARQERKFFQYWTSTLNKKSFSQLQGKCQCSHNYNYHVLRLMSGDICCKPDKVRIFTESSGLGFVTFPICRFLSGFAGEPHMQAELSPKEISQVLLEECRETDKSMYTVTEAEAEKRIIVLLEAGFPIEKAHKLFLRSPYLLKSHNFNEITQLLLEQGLSWKILLKVFQRYPRVLDINSARLNLTLKCLRNLFANEQKFYNAIISNPGILSADEKHISNRSKALKDLFKSKDALSLIVKSPSVMFDDWTDILKKFDYVFHNMGITQRQMMYSSLFDHDLHHVQCRHVFLLRAGLFKKMKKEKGELNRNPLLEEILDTNDKVFAKKFGNMTETDYISFCQYFKLEKKTIDDAYQDSVDNEVEYDSEDESEYDSAEE